MNKSSQKQTNVKQNSSFGKLNTKVSTGRKLVNKFEGLSGNLEIVEPVIIPGYKIRG